MPSRKRKIKINGFTLVELLITVAIVTILISVMVPKYVDMTQGSKEKAFEANHRMLIANVVNYEIKYHSKPASYSDILPLLNTDITGYPPGAVYTVTDGEVTSEFSSHRNPDKRILVWSG